MAVNIFIEVYFKLKRNIDELEGVTYLLYKNIAYWM